MHEILHILVFYTVQTGSYLTISPILRGHAIQELLDLWWWNRQFVLKHCYPTTKLHCVTLQKSEDFIYAMAEAWNHTIPYSLYIPTFHLCHGRSLKSQIPYSLYIPTFHLCHCRSLKSHNSLWFIHPNISFMSRQKPVITQFPTVYTSQHFISMFRTTHNFPLS
jgi:hypothetical protein